MIAPQPPSMSATPDPMSSPASPPELPQTMMTAQDVNAPESHAGSFADGVASARTPATLQTGVSPNFHPSSLLALPNVLKTTNGMASGTFQKGDPFASSMQSMLQTQNQEQA